MIKSKHLSKPKQRIKPLRPYARNCKWCDKPVQSYAGYDCNDCRDLLQSIILKPKTARKMLDALKEDK